MLGEVWLESRGDDCLTKFKAVWRNLDYKGYPMHRVSMFLGSLREIKRRNKPVLRWPTPSISGWITHSPGVLEDSEWGRPDRDEGAGTIEKRRKVTLVTLVRRRSM